MISTSMLKRQVWMVDDDVFDHIVKNSKRVLKLKDQYKNHPYVEEFRKECSVMFVYGTYVLEGEADAKSSLDDIWNLFQEDLLPNNKFCRQMINCMKAWKCLEKTSDLPLSTEIIKQTHKIIMDGEDILVGKYRKSSVLAGYYIFAPVSYIERYVEDAIFRFHETKNDDPINGATNLFEKIINIYSFEDGNGRICRLILARFDTNERLLISIHFKLFS